MCLCCLLMQKVVVVSMLKLKSDSLPSVYCVSCLINHLLTVSKDSLYGTLKVVTKPFDKNKKRLPSNTVKVSINKINLMYVSIPQP